MGHLSPLNEEGRVCIGIFYRFCGSFAVFLTPSRPTQNESNDVMASDKT